MDPFVIDALVRVLRVVALVTGALVVIDSLGVIMRFEETPPHKPKPTAVAWLIAGGSVSVVMAFLLTEYGGLVGPTAPQRAQLAILFLYGGLSIAFTTRAVSRAHRPWLVILSALGMTVAGILMVLGGIA